MVHQIKKVKCECTPSELAAYQYAPEKCKDLPWETQEFKCAKDVKLLVTSLSAPLPLPSLFYFSSVLEFSNSGRLAAPLYHQDTNYSQYNEWQSMCWLRQALPKLATTSWSIPWSWYTSTKAWSLHRVQSFVPCRQVQLLLPCPVLSVRPFFQAVSLLWAPVGALNVYVPMPRPSLQAAYPLHDAHCLLFTA